LERASDPNHSRPCEQVKAFPFRAAQGRRRESDGSGGLFDCHSSGFTRAA